MYKNYSQKMEGKKREFGQKDKGRNGMVRNEILFEFALVKLFGMWYNTTKNFDRRRGL